MLMSSKSPSRHACESPPTYLPRGFASVCAVCLVVPQQQQKHPESRGQVSQVQHTKHVDSESRKGKHLALIKFLVVYLQDVGQFRHTGGPIPIEAGCEDASHYGAASGTGWQGDLGERPFAKETGVQAQTVITIHALLPFLDACAL